MDNQNNKKSGLMKMLTAIVVLALAGFVYWKTRPVEEAVNLDNNSTTPSPVVNNRKYKDGTYSATGNYVSPAGAEEMNISLTIKDDIVVSGTFQGKAVHPTSMKMQGLFSTGFNSYVVGKQVDTITYMAVNGSSLAPKGFIDALSKIKVQAEV